MRLSVNIFLIALIVFSGVSVPLLIHAADPKITEFMASNGATLADEDNDWPDWIEIHNPNELSLNVSGYYLTDNPVLPTKWKLPAVSIAGYGYLIVFASGKDRGEPDGELHTNFQLDKEGEYLAIISKDGMTVVQQFPLDYPLSQQYPTQKQDISYGLDDQGETGYFLEPTPGFENGIPTKGFVEDTKVEPGRGFYDEAVNVAIVTATPGAEIRYTTDGSEPTDIHSMVYNGPISITKTTVLRAAAFKIGFEPTHVNSHSYIFLEDVINSDVMSTSIIQHASYGPQMRSALTDLPTISISTGSGVIDEYITPSGPYPEWTYDEVPVSVEWIIQDGSPGFQENAGVARFGGHWYDVLGRTRPFDKWSYRIYFRGQYGVTKLKYPLFNGFDHGIPPVEVFDQLELHSGSHDMSQRGFYMSARLTEDTMLEIGNLAPHGRFVHVYMNGIYLGQYLLRERWNADMHAQYLGGSKDDYESIKTHVNEGGWVDLGEPYDGNGSAWQRILSNRNSYEALVPYLDFNSYIDFMLLFMFGRSEAEYRCVGPVDQGTGFKFWLNDADGFTRSASDRATGSSNINGPGGIFIALFNEGHPDYMTLLADRIHMHYFNNGALTQKMMTERLTKRCDEIQRSFLAESARWGELTPNEWIQKRDEYINNVLPSRPVAAVEEFRAAGFYPGIEAPVFTEHESDVDTEILLTMYSSSPDIFYTTDGSDPRVPGGEISPGAKKYASYSASSVKLVGHNSNVDILVPSDESLSTAWTDTEFTTTGWIGHNGGACVGYDLETTYDPYIDYSVENAMYPVNTSIYLRYPFEISNVSNYTSLELDMRYDDGYVAYLNGQIIASQNAPTELFWNSKATESHDDNAAMQLRIAEITHPDILSLVQDGGNVLAIHGLNRGIASTDFLIEPALIGKGNLEMTENDYITISEPTTIKARALEGSQWSALAQADFDVSTSVNAQQIFNTEDFYLSNNYPNPFNGRTIIKFRVNKGSRATFEIFDILGRSLWKKDFPHIENGREYSVSLTPENWSSGILFYKLKTDFGEMKFGKMIYVK